MPPFHLLGHTAAIAGLVIVLSYWLIAVGVMPFFSTPRSMTRVGGVYFFMLCGLTHLEMSGHYLADDDLEVDGDLSSMHMAAIMIPQAVAVLMFAAGLYSDGRIGVDVPPLVDRILRWLAGNRALNRIADVLNVRLRTYASAYGAAVFGLVAAGF